jgi:hypothetical protein
MEHTMVYGIPRCREKVTLTEDLDFVHGVKDSVPTGGLEQIA